MDDEQNTGAASGSIKPQGINRALERRGQLIGRIFEGEAASQLVTLSHRGTSYGSIDELKAIFLHAALREPKIWDCSLQSILQTLMLVAELDISVTGHNNGAYFEVRNTKVRGQNGEQDRWEPRLGLGLGYNALITLVTRDGIVTSCSTGVVRQGDRFEYDEGTDAYVKHTKDLNGNPDAEVIAFYAIARMRTGEYKVEVMPAWEVRDIRRKHASEKSAAWNQSFAETGRKTPLRRLCKTLTTSTRFGSALEEFDQGHRLRDQGESSQDAPQTGINARVMGGNRPPEQAEAGQDEPEAPEAGTESSEPKERSRRDLTGSGAITAKVISRDADREKVTISRQDLDDALGPMSGIGESDTPF